ncbi:unnamed protein product [Prorocentrum cordatum]|uniref:Malate synthase n=1 Tax=Prorocentrum cordatum TaxID=2364126 RepID=A0ABN9W6C2_9DINO|nr:unnamed protein product [Polarella glacialis]
MAPKKQSQKRESTGKAGSAPPPMKRPRSRAGSAPSTPGGRDDDFDNAQPAASANNCVGPVLDIITEALNTIKTSPILADLEKTMPLTIADGGRQAPFTKQDCLDALSRGSNYTCGSNLFWQNFFWSATYKTPVNMGQVKEIRRFHMSPMSPPEVFPMTTVFAAENPAMDVTMHLGSLQRLSPIEPQLALLMSMADAVKKEAEDSVLLKWRQVALSAPVTFEVQAKGDTRYWRAHDIRQEWIETGDTAQLSVRQWVYDIVGFKEAKEKDIGKTLGSKELSQLYEKHMKYAKSTVHVKPTFVDNAITVHKRLLPLEDSNKCLVWADENLMTDSPWTSLYATQAVVERASTPNKIDWAMMGLTDHYRMAPKASGRSQNHQEFIDLGKFGVNKLRDYRESYVEVLNLKLDVKNEMLFKWLPRVGIPSDHVATIQQKMGTFAAVRAYVTGYPGDTVDTTWQALMKQSAVSAVALIEELVYTIEFDISRCTNAIQSKLDVADFLAYESVAMRTNEVIEMAKGENGTDGAEELKKFAHLQETDKQNWNRGIDKVVRTYIQIVPDQKTLAELENVLRDSALATIKGDPTGLVLYHFDAKQFGEPQYGPELRIAPLREKQYERLARSMLNARAPQGQPSHLRNGEVAVILDGGRRGNASKLFAPWKENTVEKKEAKGRGRGGDEVMEADDDDDQDGDDDSDNEPRAGFKASIIQLAHTEDSLKARRNRVHGGTGSLHQIEWAHMVAHARISIPERRRKYFEGSTAGDLITGVEVPELGKEWHVLWKDKKLMYGRKKMIAVGGKTEGIEPLQERKTDETMIPVNFHGMPMVYYNELIHMFYVKCVLDLTPTDAKFAWACLQERIAYVGVAFTKEHMEKIYSYLTDLVKQAMADAGSKLFNKDYAKSLGMELTAESELRWELPVAHFADGSELR